MRTRINFTSFSSLLSISLYIFSHDSHPVLWRCRFLSSTFPLLRKLPLRKNKEKNEKKKKNIKKNPPLWQRGSDKIRGRFGKGGKRSFGGKKKADNRKTKKPRKKTEKKPKQNEGIGKWPETSFQVFSERNSIFRFRFRDPPLIRQKSIIGGWFIDSANQKEAP